MGRYLKHDLKLGDGEMAAVIELLGLLATSMPARFFLEAKE